MNGPHGSSSEETGPSDPPEQVEETGPARPSGSTIDCLFGDYMITVRVGPRREFLGIESIGYSKDHRSPSQRISNAQDDMSQFYED